jgi:integrase
MVLSLRLMQEFGLRVEEALKIRPNTADRLGMMLVLKGSWTKGGRPRDIPIRSLSQLALLAEAKKLVGNDSMIPTGDTFIRHRRRLEHETLKRGLTNLHGLRHGYAQRRYRDLTGWDCPKAGGPDQKTFTVEQQAKDKVARQAISQELGHARVAITVVYLG